MSDKIKPELTATEIVQSVKAVRDEPDRIMPDKILAGAMRAAKKMQKYWPGWITDEGMANIARDIQRESGLAELVEAAELARKVVDSAHKFTSLISVEAKGKQVGLGVVLSHIDIALANVKETTP